MSSPASEHRLRVAHASSYLYPGYGQRCGHLGGLVSPGFRCARCAERDRAVESGSAWFTSLAELLAPGDALQQALDALGIASEHV